MTQNLPTTESQALMLAFATEQNSVVAIPIANAKDSLQIIILSTPLARINKWDIHLRDAIDLIRENCQADICDLEAHDDVNESTINKFLKKTLDEFGCLRDHTKKIILNIGGGTKLHVWAMLNLFNELDKNNIEIQYADFKGKTIRCQNKKTAWELSMSRQLRLNEILSLYGLKPFTVDKPDAQDKYQNVVREYFSNEDYRRYYYRGESFISEIELINFYKTRITSESPDIDWINTIINNCNEPSHRVYEQLKLGFLNNEECLCQWKDRVCKNPNQSICQILAQILNNKKDARLYYLNIFNKDESPNPPNPIYIEACIQKEIIDYLKPKEQNIEYHSAVTFKEKNEDHHVFTNLISNIRSIAEHDLLFVLPSAELISLDVKTGTVLTKDYHARMYNMRRSAGNFTKFWIIVPFYGEDWSHFSKKLKDAYIQYWYNNIKVFYWRHDYDSQLQKGKKWYLYFSKEDTGQSDLKCSERKPEVKEFLELSPIQELRNELRR